MSSLEESCCIRKYVRRTSITIFVQEHVEWMMRPLLVSTMRLVFALDLL